MVAPYFMPVQPQRIVPQNGDIVVREKKRARLNLFLEPSLKRDVENHTAMTGEDLSEFTRKALTNEMAGRTPSGFNTFSAPLLGAVPCGPWQEAVDRGGRFQVSVEVADALEARDGDVWVRASGQSMEGAGIVDGFLVLIRPKGDPRRHEIWLTQVNDADNNCVGTIKRFDGFEKDGKTPRLLDGEGNQQSLPEEISSVEYIGRAVGVIGRL